jgi:hypothetical protein
MVGSGLALAADAANLAAERSDSHVWIVAAWIVFGVAILLTGYGILRWR